MMPTPKGIVSVRYVRDGGAWKAAVTLPAGLPGELRWGERVIALHAGEQEVVLR
jgi:hypothetical protein